MYLEWGGFLKIRVDEIKDKPRLIKEDEPISNYAELAALQDEGVCKFLGSLSTSLEISREYDHIRVEGRVSTSVKLTCSRCLVEFDLPIDSQFTVYYTKSSGEPLDEEVELAEHDLISLSYDGEEIDFTHGICEQVVMDIPYKPLCREECKGLCPSCGADLNAIECACKSGEINLKFSALKDFKVKK